jgi:tetratricopeptide (TPR) repeat protein
MNLRRILVGTLCLLLIAGAAWWWQQAGRQQAITLKALPRIPDLSTAPATLREQIVAADSRARGRWLPAKGLAELSRLYHANGLLDEAAGCYAGLEQLAPAEPRWPHLDATILAGFGEIEPAVKLWQQVIRLAPEYVPARLRLGDCLLKSNRPDEAAAAYAGVLKLDPSNSYATLGLARIDLEAQRWDSARQRLEEVVARTNYVLGYDLIVSLYERLGLVDKAAAIRGSTRASGNYRDPPDPWLDQLMDFCFDPYRLSLSAGTLARDGDSSRAIQLLKRAIELAPEDVSSHFQLGGIAKSQKNFAVARDEFTSCTVLDPTFADGWIQLSLLQTEMGDPAAAERTLAAGLAHCPDSPSLHLMRARNLHLAGMNGEAITEFLTSIRLRPNEPDAYADLGNLYIESGNEAEGLDKLKEALEADPGFPFALSVLAFHAISTGNESEARQWLARVANQPRVPHDQVSRLLETYQQTFGHAWAPEKPNE